MKAIVLAITAIVAMGWAKPSAAEEKSAQSPGASEPRVSVLTSPEKGPRPSARPFHVNLDELVSKNRQYRHVIFTGRMSQLALMSIPPGGDIGYESHEHVEQLLFVQSGRGRVVIAGEAQPIGPGDVVVATPGVGHDIVNTGDEPLQIFTVYTPPNHIPGREQATKAAAEADHADEEYGHRVGSEGK